MAKAEHESPIKIHVYTSGPKKHQIEIERCSTRQTLATCMIGDDDAVERVADILSEKGLPREAMKLRQVVRDARRRR